MSTVLTNFFKGKINWIVEYEATQLEKMGVEIRLNTPATKELLAKINPYAILVATGACPIKPASIPGIDKAIVKTAKEVCNKVVLVGDASAPGRIESAVRTAFEAAYSL